MNEKEGLDPSQTAVELSDDLFEDNESEEAEETVAEDASEAEETEEPAEVAESPEEPVEEAPKRTEDRVPVATFLETKHRLKEAEAELARVRAGTEKAPPEFLDDPEGFISARDEKLRSEFSERELSMRAQLSEKFARQQWQDFDEMATEFAKAAEVDPKLVEQARADQDPAGFVYRTGLTHKEMSADGFDIAAYRDRTISEAKAKAKAELEAEIRAELTAEFEKGRGVSRSMASRKNKSPAAPATEEGDLDDMGSFALDG